MYSFSVGNIVVNLAKIYAEESKGMTMNWTAINHWKLFERAKIVLWFKRGMHI